MRINSQVSSKVGEVVANEAMRTSHNEIVGELKNALRDRNILFNEIKSKITSFIANLEKNNYDTLIKYNREATLDQKEQQLKEIIDLVYGDFLEIQNLINEYLGHRIVMTYVHINNNGEREIRIFDNDFTHLKVESGYNFKKIGFEVEQNYKVLKNSLPDNINQNLTNTAKEVERRYSTYKKQILWKINHEWKGYRMTTKGPINEAYVNMYIHEIKLKNSLEKNIDTFMLDPNHGAIQADNTKGYLIGDVRKDGIQYAVKGKFGSPQGYRQIITEFQKILQEDFSQEAFENFIRRFYDEELDKKYKSHIRKMSSEDIQKVFEDFPQDYGRK